MQVARPEELDIWAGAECSVVRVGDVLRDELELTGHAHRPEDLDRIAAMGVRRIRQPVIWERTAPCEPERCEWSWADQRLRQLRKLGIAPIVGLLHHGSGPVYTSLIDPAMPELLAHYASQVAERYPWIDAWTPVNEPLTTARFSGLYGLWYPHAHSDVAMVKALLTQLRGVVLAMAAVRRVNPQAKLVQTDDLGFTHSTGRLRYQADFENQRRWLTFDILCGRVGTDHPLWSYLLWAGADERDLRWFLERPCPPDIIGVNHYLTSERFLDERLERYPSCTHGGNIHHRYADVEAVRVLRHGVAGPAAFLLETWDRYGIPVAVTEVHNGCTREEQLRWFVEVLRAAREARRKGAEIVAVTLWSVFGSADWNSLLTRVEGELECGAWDVCVPQPRPTILARAVSELLAGKPFDHPVLDETGWWHRSGRLIYPAAKSRIRAPRSKLPAKRATNPRVILISGTGTLGRAFSIVCGHRGLPHRLLTRREMDIADPASVGDALDRLRPWAIINAAGYVRVEQAEREIEACWRENVTGAEVLASECARRGLPMLTFSSDLVFDGCADRGYVESDEKTPSTVYGRSKGVAEESVQAILPNALIIRTSAFFGPWDVYNHPLQMLRALANGETVSARADRIVSPSYVPDLVHRSLELLIDGESGLWHLANDGALSWYELAVTAAQRAEIITGRIEPVYGRSSRPFCTALHSERGPLMAPLENALARFIAARPWERALAS